MYQAIAHYIGTKSKSSPKVVVSLSSQSESLEDTIQRETEILRTRSRISSQIYPIAIKILPEVRSDIDAVKVQEIWHRDYQGRISLPIRPKSIRLEFYENNFENLFNLLHDEGFDMFAAIQQRTG